MSSIILGLDWILASSLRYILTSVGVKGEKWPTGRVFVADKAISTDRWSSLTVLKSDFCLCKCYRRRTSSSCFDVMHEPVPHSSPSMSDSCANSGGPPMNTDISGIGVRVSFYLQTVFLGNTLFSCHLVLFQSSTNPGCLSARSTSPEEVAGALYTLLATNTGMAVTALILGFKSRPEISLHECVPSFFIE
jgi:hypothetical protein